jgi:NAD(P)-dependent dehydrogenase (short-subunit alcohol dehydrogenase family)
MPLSIDLAGRRAVVTGASKGLGAAIATMLAANGAQVRAVARGAADLAALCAAQPGIEPWVADVGDLSFADELAAGEIDILVNNAATHTPLPMADVPIDVLDAMLNLNIRASYLAAQAAVRAMLRQNAATPGRGGAIVNITSQMGHVGSPRRTVYCTTKHALEGLTKAMAIELAGDNIRVNSVAPTFIETPMTAPMLADPAFRAFVLESIPLNRIGMPDDVAAAVLYLVSPAAGMITGHSLLVDGGWTAR